MPAHTATVHRDPSDGRARLPILIAALLLVASMAFIGSGIAGTAHAQAERGAIPSLNLASSEPGQLVITWETPEPAPTDYRLSWAYSSLDFPSYRDPNVAEKGNLYPAGDATTLTLDDLTPGENYKVQLRARYYNADRSVHEWSGPWTATATKRVKNHPPAAPTGLTASPVDHDRLTLTWDDPQDANITGYRVLRGPDAGSLSTIEADTGSASTEYTDATVAPETTYFYAVLALSLDGDGPQSSAISATTPAAPAAPPAISIVVPSDALTDRMTQLEVNLTNLPAGRYNVRVTVTTDAADSAAEVAAHDAVLVVSDPPQSSQQQATESDTVLPINQWGYVSVSPGTPTVTQDGAEVLISWTPGVGNVRNYQVERFATPCQRICRSMIHTDGAGTSYRDVSVNSGRTYVYRVRAMYANGRSVFSAGATITTAAVVEGVPKPPSGLTARYDAYTAAIVLSWTAPDPASDVRNYRLLRCSWTSLQDKSCGQFLTGSTDTAYSDTNVEPGHSYSYNNLRAVGDGGDSYPTGWVQIFVPAAAR